VTLGRTLYSLLVKQEAVTPQLLPYFVTYRIPRRGVHGKYDNYTAHLLQRAIIIIIIIIIIMQ
jgi:hypothetical protein